MPVNSEAWAAAQAAAADPKTPDYPAPGVPRTPQYEHANARQVAGSGRRGAAQREASQRVASRQRADSDPEGR